MWRVSSWLQNGRYNTRETFLDDVARAASIILVFAKDKIVGDWFSLKKALGCFKRFVAYNFLCDILFKFCLIVLLLH